VSLGRRRPSANHDAARGKVFHHIKRGKEEKEGITRLRARRPASEIKRNVFYRTAQLRPSDDRRSISNDLIVLQPRIKRKLLESLKKRRVAQSSWVTSVDSKRLLLLRAEPRNEEESLHRKRIQDRTALKRKQKRQVRSDSTDFKPKRREAFVWTRVMSECAPGGGAKMIWLKSRSLNDTKKKNALDYSKNEQKLMTE